MAGTVQYYNLTGGLNTVQGIGTINQSPRRTESPDMQNVEYYKLGGLKSMEGNTRFGNQLPAPITLGYEYIFKNDKFLIVTTNDGNVYQYNKVQDEYNKIYTFATPTDRHSICSFNNGIVISNGVDDLVYYQYQRHEELTGTVTISEGSSGVNGVDTHFSTELGVGDFIIIDGNSYRVDTITSDTLLTLTSTAKTSAERVNFFLSEFSELNATYTNSDDEDNIHRPVRGLALQSYKGRIFVGANDGVLYYSEVGLIHGWDVKYGAGAIPSFYEDNSDFTALAVWDKYLVLCKRERSYLLNGNSDNDVDWTIEPYSDYTCDSQQSWLSANNSLLVYSRVAGGIYPLLQRTIYNANYQGVDLSLKIRDSFEYINQAKYDYIFPVYHPQKGYVMFYMPFLTSRGSNNCFVFDVRTKTWMFRKVPQEVTIAFRYKDRIYIGTQDGLILEEFRGTTFDGEAIEWYWKSPWFSFGQGTNYLSTREFRLNLSQEGTNKFYVRNHRDGKDSFRARKITGSFEAFTGLVWDLGYNKADLAPDYKIQRTIYEVTDGENNYYILQAGDKDTVVGYGSKLYTDETLTDNAGFVGLNYRLVDSPVEGDDGVLGTTKVEQTAYKWSHTHKAYAKYSDGTHYVWIPWDKYKPETGGECLYSNNIAPSLLGYEYVSKPRRLSLYLVNGMEILILNGVTISPFFISATEPIINSDGSFTPQDKTTLQAKALSLSDDSGSPITVTSCKLLGSKDNLPKLNLQMSGYASKSGINWSINDADISNNQYWTCTSVMRNEAGVIAVGDIPDAQAGILGSVTLQEDGKYTVVIDSIEVKDLEFVGEDGDDITDTFYTLEPTIVNGTSLTVSPAGRVTATGIDNNQAIYLINNIAFTPINEGTETYYTNGYKVRETITYTYTGTTSEQPIPWAITPPSEEQYDIESLTDTVWDEDSWVILSHIVKRFPLADQFFQTLQIELYGNDVNEGMTLNGFEIDGVQLEEIPW